MEHKNIFKTGIVMLYMLWGISGWSQTSSDSLHMVKNYLIEIKETAVSNRLKKSKAIQLKHLLRSGTQYKGIFERNIRRTKSKEQAEELIKSFNIILQSAILYKYDLLETNADSEMIYLKNNIPRLLKELD